MKFSQKEIKEKLAEWEVINEKISKLQNVCNKKMEPFVREHNEKVSPFLDAFEEKVAPFRSQLNALESEILNALNSNLDADGNKKLVTIEQGCMVATVTKREKARLISVEKFFEVVKVKTAPFWECVTVAVGKAEKFLGKTEIDKISERPIEYVASVGVRK